MCFKVIKRIVEYIELKYKDNKPNYTITTNGLLLKRKDIANVLKKYGFWVCVSLDAYPENHNRNRVDRNKNPTYSNIKEIIEENFKNYNDIFTLAASIQKLI